MQETLCFVKRAYKPAFTAETMPRLLYVSRRQISEQAIGAALVRRRAC